MRTKSVQSSKRHLILCVDDQTIGLQVRRVLLERAGYRAFLHHKNEQGTGLGLWFSRGVITKHGGTLELTSSTASEVHGTRANAFLAREPVIHTSGD